MYDREVLNQLRSDGELLQRVITTHVALQPAGGGELKGRCPFHQEKTASFYVIPDKGFCHCFGCKWGGDVFDFLQTLLGLDFRASVAEVADEAGVLLDDTEEYQAQRRMRSSLLEVCAVAHAFFRKHLRDPAPQSYLVERGLQAAVTEWELGYAPDSWDSLSNYLANNRVSRDAAVKAGVLCHKQHRYFDFFRGRLIFPIRDNRGRVVAFAGRAMSPDQQPKYINTPSTELYDKSDILFGLAKASPSIRSNARIILVEGYTDVIACHAAGATEAVATCGTALTPEHVTRISRLTCNVVEAKDPDNAGMNAMEKDLVPLLQAGLNVTRVPLPGLDPDDLFQQQGGEALLTCISQAQPLLPEVLQRLSRRFPYTPQGRQQAADAAVPLLRVMRGIARQEAVQLAARLLSVSHHQLRRMVGQQHQPIQVEEGHREFDATVAPVLWALLHHEARARPLVVDGLKPDWVSDQERTAVLGLLLGTPFPELLMCLEPWAARHLRSLAANRALYGAGQVRALVRECCLRAELAHVDARMGAQVNGTRFGLQQRRVQIMDALGGVAP